MSSIVQGAAEAAYGVAKRTGTGLIATTPGKSAVLAQVRDAIGRAPEKAKQIASAVLAGSAVLVADDLAELVRDGSLPQAARDGIGEVIKQVTALAPRDPDVIEEHFDQKFGENNRLAVPSVFELETLGVELLHVFRTPRNVATVLKFMRLMDDDAFLAVCADSNNDDLNQLAREIEGIFRNSNL